MAAQWAAKILHRDAGPRLCIVRTRERAEKQLVTEKIARRNGEGTFGKYSLERDARARSVDGAGGGWGGLPPYSSGLSIHKKQVSACKCKLLHSGILRLKHSKIGVTSDGFVVGNLRTKYFKHSS